MNFQSFPPSLLILSPRLTRTGAPGASIEGINTTTLADGAFVYCAENKAEYQLDRTSAAAPDGNTVIAPSAGPGRWLKVLPAGGGAACTSNNLTITGLYACAENDSNTASGQASFAIGTGTVASGYSSHSQGSATQAAGSNSRASCNSTRAQGSDSSAEGVGAQAIGDASHAEGGSGIACGSYAHAEGEGTGANGRSSHAEGASCRAGRLPYGFSVAAGLVTVTIAGGDATADFPLGVAVVVAPQIPAILGIVTRVVATPPVFAAGDTTFDLDLPVDALTTYGVICATDQGETAHAEGSTSVATGFAAHAEGVSTQATGYAAHAEGRSIVGYPQVASGVASHAEGSGNDVRGESAHAEGERNAVGYSPQPATLAAGGTTITMVGDQTFLFPFGASGGTVILEPTAPVAGAPVTVTVIDCPVWNSGPNETTFTISAPIDGTTTDVNVSVPNWGRAAHAEGIGHIVLGAASSAKGIAARALFGNTAYHGGDGEIAGFGQFGRYVISGIALPATGAFSAEMAVWAGAASVGALYFLRTTFVVNDQTGGAWFAEERRSLVQVSSARVVTVLTDAIAYTADPMATGITTAVVAGGTGSVSLAITWPAPTANNETYAITVEWTEVSSVLG